MKPAASNGLPMDNPTLLIGHHWTPRQEALGMWSFSVPSGETGNQTGMALQGDHVLPYTITSYHIDSHHKYIYIIYYSSILS